MTPPPRPFGVLLLALAQILQGLTYLSIAIVLELVLLAGAVENADKRGFVALFGLIYLFLGVYALLLARGYLRGYEWARRRGIGMATFAIVVAIVAIFIIKVQGLLTGSPFGTIVLNLVIVWYLRREKTKRHFASRQARSAGKR
jgi:hypothetical protein